MEVIDEDVYWEPIFPITALSKEPKKVKEAARDKVVRITENGCGAYVFASEAALKALIAREREDAKYEAYLMRSIDRGLADVEAGRYVTSQEEMFAEAAKRRKAYA